MKIRGDQDHFFFELKDPRSQTCSLWLNSLTDCSTDLILAVMIPLGQVMSNLQVRINTKLSQMLNTTAATFIKTVGQHKQYRTIAFQRNENKPVFWSGRLNMTANFFTQHKHYMIWIEWTKRHASAVWVPRLLLIKIWVLSYEHDLHQKKNTMRAHLDVKQMKLKMLSGCFWV